MFGGPTLLGLSMVNTSLIALTVLTCLTDVPLTESAIDEQWLQRARVEVRSWLDKYRTLSAFIEEEYELHYTRPLPLNGVRDGNATNKVVRFFGSRIGKNGMTERRTWFNDQTAISTDILLDCANENYQFRLRKSSIDGPYVLLAYGQLKPDDEVPQGFFHMNAFQELAQLQQAIEANKLLGLQWDANRQLLMARFRTEHNGKVVVEDEQLWLDPQDCWRVVEAKKVTVAAYFSVKLRYGQAINGLSFPSDYASEFVLKTAQSKEPDRIEGKLLRIGMSEKTPKDFRLSAFGLPEPADAVVPRTTPNYVWLILSAGMCAILALVTKFAARRLAAAKVA